MIETRRLRLVPLRPEDADEMVGVLAGEALYTFTGGEPPDLATLRRRFTAMARGHSPDGREVWLNWIVRQREDDRAVGTVQATVTDGGRRAEVAWVTGLAWQGRGYAREAVAAMVTALTDAGVEHLIAHVHPGHAASEAIAAASGLTVTDTVVDGERRWEWAAPGAETPA